MEVAIFTFNPFQENTYVLYDTFGSCIIIDPGCINEEELNTLYDFIEANSLTPTHLVNTHCHIDHVLGNKAVSEKYGLSLTSHRGEQQVLDMQPQVSTMYGLPYVASPDITEFLDDGDTLTFGDTNLKVLFTPGHSPASISFYWKDGNILIAGDVLFRDSIGRTDLPGGSFDTLSQSIKEKFYTLPDDTIVYPGHGPSTTIGYEKINNAFVKAN